MAYDRYDTRQGPRDERSRWSENDRYDREREQGGREDRGFFERAGDEIASWFGGGDDEDHREQRGSDRSHGSRDQRDYQRDWNSGRPSGRERDEGRHDGDNDRYRPTQWSSSERDYRSGGRETWGGGRDHARDRDRGSYRPMTGDYSRSEGFFAASGGEGRNRDRPESNWDRDQYRRTSFAGSSERSQNHDHDPHYHAWRQRQIDALDRDYDDYRREHQSKFENDFGNWRERRMGKRQMLGQIREHMEVVGSDEQHVGTVDRIAGDRIILTKSDPESGGAHHSLSCHEVGRVEGDKVILDCTAEQAKQRWRDESRSRALFEREDQGEAGAHMLDRSFSGTYR